MTEVEERLSRVIAKLKTSPHPSTQVLVDDLEAVLAAISQPNRRAT